MPPSTAAVASRRNDSGLAPSIATTTAEPASAISERAPKRRRPDPHQASARASAGVNANDASAAATNAPVTIVKRRVHGRRVKLDRPASATAEAAIDMLATLHKRAALCGSNGF